MALDLTELEDKQKSQLRKPKRSNLKKMNPWDKFETEQPSPNIEIITNEESTPETIKQQIDNSSTSNVDKKDKLRNNSVTKENKIKSINTKETKNHSLTTDITKDATKDKTTDIQSPIPAPAGATDSPLTTDTNKTTIRRQLDDNA